MQEGKIIAGALESGNDWEKSLKAHQKKWESFLVASYKSIVEELGTAHFENLVKGFAPHEFKRYVKEEEEPEEIDPIHFFNPHEEDITKYIIEIAGTKVTMVSDWTRQVIGALVLESQENNWTMDELAKSIKDEFKEFSRYRAYTISPNRGAKRFGLCSSYSRLKSSRAIRAGNYRRMGDKQ